MGVDVSPLSLPEVTEVWCGVEGCGRARSGPPMLLIGSVAGEAAEVEVGVCPEHRVALVGPLEVRT